VLTASFVSNVLMTNLLDGGKKYYQHSSVRTICSLWSGNSLGRQRGKDGREKRKDQVRNPN